MTKYYISQSQNGKTLVFGDFNANNPKEAVKMACKTAKEKYPQYNYNKSPFKIKEYGHKQQEVMYRG